MSAKVWHDAGTLDKLSSILIAVLALVLLAVEHRWPPVTRTEVSTAWGQEQSHNLNSRRSLEPDKAERLVDRDVQLLELAANVALLIVTMVPDGVIGSGATGRLAAASLVFHAGTFVFPLASGVWIASNPAFVFLYLLQIVPHAILIVALIRLVRQDADFVTLSDARSFVTKRWVRVLAIIAAILLTCWSFSKIPFFVVSPFSSDVGWGTPLSGIWSATFAMWLKFFKAQSLRPQSAFWKIRDQGSSYSTGRSGV